MGHLCISAIMAGSALSGIIVSPPAVLAPETRPMLAGVKGLCGGSGADDTPR